MSTSNASLTSLADVSVPFAPPAVLGVADSELLDLQRELGEIARRVESASAVVAAEIAHRSRPDLGYEGLAQRLGTRTPQQLVQRLTGGTSRDAATLVRVGSMIPVTDASRASAPDVATELGRASIADAEPWLRAVGSAVAAGRLSVAAADAIRTGLGVPGDAIGEPALAAAAERLVAQAPGQIGRAHV